LSTLTLNSIIFIFKLVNELSIYSQVNDSNNEEIMSTWLKSFIEKTLETSNSSYFVNYLIKLLKMNHLILDSHINRIFKKLNVIEFQRLIFKKIYFISISLESRFKPVFEQLFRYACKC
jgi:presenilin-like A22 family membrane protease